MGNSNSIRKTHSQIELEEINFDNQQEILSILFDRELFTVENNVIIINNEAYISDMHIKAHRGTIYSGYFTITMYTMKTKITFYNIFMNIINDENIILFEILFRISLHVYKGPLCYDMLHFLIIQDWTETHQKMADVVYKYDNKIVNRQLSMNGRTLVHVASVVGNAQALEWLYNHKACLDIIDKFEKKPIDYARDNNHKYCETFLKCYTTFTLFDACEKIDYILENDEYESIDYVQTNDITVSS